MLRIHQHTSSAATRSYYTAADYYAEEAQGQWIGRGAEALGLTGAVNHEAFEALCENLHPMTGERLTALNAADRTVAYDFNFNACKSLSVLHALTGDERLREALEASVRETTLVIEAEMKTRVRRDGADGERLTCNLVGSLFTHTTTRPVDGLPDPHLHCHVVVFNCTHDPEERRWKAAQFRELKRDAPHFEALFHSHLAHRVRELGYGIERTTQGWEITGVGDSVRQLFSQRTRDIERLAQERGITDPEEKSQIGAKSRTGKATQYTPEELRQTWCERLGSDALADLQKLRGACEAGSSSDVADRRGADVALEYAVERGFARDSVIAERTLETLALRRGFGTTAPAVLRDAFKRFGFIRGDEQGRGVVTTREVLAEEQRFVAWARDGRGVCAALGGGIPHAFQREYLNRDQRQAVRSILESPDRVLLVRGRAGVGKTTLLKEAVEAIEARGRAVFAFAPSADASRGTLRQEGFASADTVARLLHDQRMQAKLQGQVLLIDEAGQLGSRTMARVFALAERLEARVICVGDTAQHRGVERGSALRILEQQAGVPSIEVNDIQRQRGDYKSAVEALAEGRIRDGFDRLDDLGWVREVADGEARAGQLADEYVSRTQNGQSVLVVAPTRAEGVELTSAIRSALRRVERLGNEEKTFLRLVPTQRTEAERSDPASFQAGEVIQFVQNAKGFTRGERFTVHRTETQGAGQVLVLDRQGRERALPLNQADRFEVFSTDVLPLAVGDRVRFTLGGLTTDGHRLNNGGLYSIAGFTSDGETRLDNGWVVPREFGHWMSGFTVTSHASQGKTVDHVLIAQSRFSGRAASPEQLYVATSRGKQGATLYVDDKAAVREAVAKIRPVTSAHDLVGTRPGPAERPDWLRRFAYRLRDAARWLAESVRGEQRLEQNRRQYGRLG